MGTSDACIRKPKGPTCKLFQVVWVPKSIYKSISMMNPLTFYLRQLVHDLWLRSERIGQEWLQPQRMLQGRSMIRWRVPTLSVRVPFKIKFNIIKDRVELKKLVQIDSCNNDQRTVRMHFYEHPMTSQVALVIVCSDFCVLLRPLWKICAFYHHFLSAQVRTPSY